MNKINNLIKLLNAASLEWGLDYISGAEEKICKLHSLLNSGNLKMSLTTITEPHQFITEHVIDSLAPMHQGIVNPKDKIIDIGTGAGFPGLPLAICSPSVEITLVDATLKKTKWLESTCRNLGLPNTKVIWARAEELAREREHRGKYNLAVVRAMGKISIIMECAIPFLQIGGTLVIYKGPKVENEIEVGAKAASQLGGEIIEVQRFLLPTTKITRSLVIVKKIRETPSKYPRRPGIPKKRPLGIVP